VDPTTNRPHPPAAAAKVVYRDVAIGGHQGYQHFEWSWYAFLLNYPYFHGFPYLVEITNNYAMGCYAKFLAEYWNSGSMGK
jgi:hypothetical protein